MSTLQLLETGCFILQPGKTEEDTFTDGFDGWTLPDKSWQRWAYRP
jgi:hypothetical protein